MNALRERTYRKLLAEAKLPIGNEILSDIRVVLGHEVDVHTANLTVASYQYAKGMIGLERLNQFADAHERNRVKVNK
jgi:hypothetical protein